MKGASSTDIAVIGMACRFPGARDPEQYWDNLAAGRTSIQEVPVTRWRWQDYVDSQSPKNVSYCRWGGFIDDVDAFDAPFFNFSAREVQSLDPQQRLALELAWSCCEDAGIRPSFLSGGNVGVFLGSTNLDYKEIMDVSPIDTYYATGTLSSVIPNRISYYFNLRGPSVAIDTACSSSLQAIHMACAALRHKECDVALTGGISLLLTPKRFLWYGKAGILSPTGTLRTFDESADGTVRGEGAGLILLKPLARAIADGNRIIGVIKGSAVNHCGRTYTLTYPSADAQAEVIINALQSAGVTSADVTYVEAHGTATVKGDPIEVQGLVRAFQAAEPHEQSRTESRWCGLGSVKPNIGHLEGAAGIAGVIKVLLALRHKTLPPLAQFTSANSRINLGNSFYFVEKLQPWEARGPRIAGVSSFGFAGTNAHVVLAEAPVTQEKIPFRSHPPHGQSVIVLSGRDSDRLKEQARQLHNVIQRQHLSDSDLESLAFTLQVGREEMLHRAGLIARSLQELYVKLEQWLGGKQEIEGLFISEVKKNADADVGIEAPSEASDKWVQESNWAKLVELWSKGMAFDWNRLYGEPKPGIISLPTYPFARERYWISPPAQPLPAAARARLHALVHQNTSDLVEQRFSSEFTGREFFFTDHRILGQSVLPAAAYLEMVREAVIRAVIGYNRAPQTQTVKIRNLMWLRPVVAGIEPVEVHIRLVPKDQGQVAFEVYSGSGSAAELIHAQGVAVTAPNAEAPRVDVEALTRRYQLSSYSTIACYSVFAQLGIEYGERHRCIQGLHVEGNEAVVRLSQPVSNWEDAFALHPGMIDSGLQAIIGFILASSAPHAGMAPFVPFELKNAEIYSPTVSEMWGIVRRTPPADLSGIQNYDIDFCDLTGRVCVRLNGLSTRPVKNKREQFSRLPVETALAVHFEHAANAAEEKISQSTDQLLRFSSVMHEETPGRKPSEPIAIVGIDDLRARVLQEKEKYHIELCDKYGQVSGYLHGWNARSAQGDLKDILSVEAPDDGEVVLTPSWEPVSLKQGDHHLTVPAGGLVVIGSTSSQRSDIQQFDRNAAFIDSDETLKSLSEKISTLDNIRHLVWIVPRHLPDDWCDDSVIAEQSHGVIFGFRLIKSILAAGYGDKALTWTVVTTGVEAVHANEPTNPTHASIHGLVGSVAHEYAHWTVRVLDLPASGDWPWEDILAALTLAGQGPMVYRDGRWYQQQLLPYRLLNDTPMMGRPGEVYVIIGGHSGIGAAWSEVLLRWSSVQLVWVGRRPMDSVLQSRIARLAEIGPVPFYISADAADRQQLERVRSLVLQKFGRIDGLIHSAMVLHDQTLASMTEDAFIAALRPKIDGSVRLAQVFRQDALRFVLFFSSCDSFIKLAGQSNYVAGCTFKDSFARRMAGEWPCRVRIVNWGYWGTVGAAASERYRTFMERKGLGAIELLAATRILDELISGRVVQMVYLKRSHGSTLQSFNIRSDEWATSSPETLPSCLAVIEQFCNAANTREWSLSPDWCWDFEKLDAIVLDLLWSQLHSMGLFGERGDCFEPTRTSEKISPQFTRWLEYSIRMLEGRGHLAGCGEKSKLSGSTPADPAAVWAQWESQKKQWLENDVCAASAELAQAMLHNLPDILTGRSPASEILFADLFVPTSSAKLVKMMRSAPAARVCNETMAGVVVRYIEERRAQDPHCRLRILEIGAGTDATTQAVLGAIAPLANWIREYTCTNASLPLVSAARKWLSSDTACVTHRVFDVERAPDAQGIPLDTYDLVIAGNIMHAAKDIRKAVRNAKAALKTNGFFILHEFTANTTIHHLTFGLMDTWWRCDNVELPISGGSAVTPAIWKTLLQQEGFNSVLFPAEKTHEYGYRIVIAQSDGVVRQCLAHVSILQDQKHPRAEATDENTAPRAADAHGAATIDEVMNLPRPAAIEHLLTRVLVHTAKALGINLATLDLGSRSFPDMLLGELGVDSLSASDLRSSLRQELGVDMSAHRLIGEKVHKITDAIYDELLIRRMSNPGAPSACEDRETYVF